MVAAAVGILLRKQLAAGAVAKVSPPEAQVAAEMVIAKLVVDVADVVADVTVSADVGIDLSGVGKEARPVANKQAVAAAPSQPTQALRPKFLKPVKRLRIVAHSVARVLQTLHRVA